MYLGHPEFEGFEVIPRNDFSAIRRANSPSWTSDRLRKSSQGLVPASTSERRFGLTLVASVVLIAVLPGLTSGAARRAGTAPETQHSQMFSRKC